MLASIEQLRSYLHTGGTVSAGSTIDAGLLEALLGAASSRMEEAASRRTLDLVPAKTITTPASGDTPAVYAEGSPVAMTFPLIDGQTVIHVPDLRSVTSITADAVELDPSAYGLVKRYPRDICALWVKLRRPVRAGELTITGHWGPAGAKVGTTLATLDVRSDVREACIVWAARGFHNRTARYADQVQDPQGGVSNYFRILPADVKIVIESLDVPHA